MKKQKNILVLSLITLIVFSAKNTEAQTTAETQKKETVSSIKLGAFSTSLNVKDLNASKIFYKKLGFTVLGGDLKMNYLIMKNGNALIGLFHGMFEGNILTFNPGWDESGKNIEPFDDVRVIENHLNNNGIELDTAPKPNTKGPASVTLKDPDGNVIFIDQHR